MVFWLFKAFVRKNYKADFCVLGMPKNPKLARVVYEEMFKFLKEGDPPLTNLDTQSRIDHVSSLSQTVIDDRTEFAAIKGNTMVSGYDYMVEGNGKEKSERALAKVEEYGIMEILVRQGITYDRYFWMITQKYRAKITRSPTDY